MLLSWTAWRIISARKDMCAGAMTGPRHAFLMIIQMAAPHLALRVQENSLGLHRTSYERVQQQLCGMECGCQEINHIEIFIIWLQCRCIL